MQIKHFPFFITILFLLLFTHQLSAQNQVINGDLYVQGSECIGMDCPTSTSFGFSTLLFMENNLRIRFDDTSTDPAFPGNDWEIQLNSSSSGGGNYYSVWDMTAGRKLFTLEAGAPNNALYLDDEGNLGIGTDNPVTDIEVQTGNTPTLRLDQDGSNGFASQSWDIAGNESNFFIRDVNGSKLPFRIKPGAPENSLFIAANGNIGLGTDSPDERLDVDNGKLLVQGANAAVQFKDMGAMPGYILSALDNDGNLEFQPAAVIANESQELDLIGNTLSITNGSNNVDLSGYLDNSDGQTLTLSTADQLSITNGNTVDLSTYLDNTDDQTLTLSTANQLSIESANSVDLSPYLDNTDMQDMSLSGNTLSLTNDATSVDLSGYLDDTDQQDLSLSGNTLSLTNDATTVDLSSYLNTDAQDLSLTGNTLNLTNDATTVDLSGYLDNTDQQDLSLNGNTLSLSNDASTVDLSVYLDDTDTDQQDLSLSGNTLSLTNDATTVDLSVYLDDTDTDQQDLSLSGNMLSLTNDATPVDISGYLDNTDDQNLTAATLTGTQLQIDIENGSSASVDLASLVIQSNDADFLDEITGLTATANNDDIYTQGRVRIGGTSIDINSKLNVQWAESCVGCNKRGVFSKMTGGTGANLSGSRFLGGEFVSSISGGGQPAARNGGLVGRAIGTGFQRNYGVAGQAKGDTLNTGGIFYAIVSTPPAGTSSTNIGVHGKIQGTAANTTNWSGFMEGAPLFYQSSFTPSDRKLKKDIRPIRNALELIESLEGKSYEFDIHTYGYLGYEKGTHYGFISQDVARIFPDLTRKAVHQEVYKIKEVIDDEGVIDLIETNEIEHEAVAITAMNYIEIIPILTEGIKEQQQIIESQNEKIENQEERIQKLESMMEVLLSDKAGRTRKIFLDKAGSREAWLGQNVPNPFTKITRIDMYLPTELTEVMLEVRDLQGRVVLTEQVSERGEVRINLKVGALAEGAYTYSLIADGNLAGTKKMVVSD